MVAVAPAVTIIGRLFLKALRIIGTSHRAPGMRHVLTPGLPDLLPVGQQVVSRCSMMTQTTRATRKITAAGNRPLGRSG